MQLKSMATVALASGIVSSSMAADAVQWRVEDGGNGHWYAYLPTVDVQTQAGARAIAGSHGGDLVCLASEEEWVAVRSYVDQLQLRGAFWIWTGAFRDHSTAWQWTWSDGTPWTFAAWNICVPNNPPAGFVAAVISPGYPCGSAVTAWDDVTEGSWDVTMTTGCLVEWSADCNNDGIVDYGQCRDGSLPDYDGNNIPDCCEHGAACVVGSYPVQWRIEAGGNGHWYSGVRADRFITWSQAKSACVSRGALLASIGVSSESDWLYETIAHKADLWTNNGPYVVGPWIGGRGPSGEWRWDDGTPWTYSAWHPGEGPPSPDPNEQFAHFFNGVGAIVPANQWGDYFDVPVTPSYIIEWSADCNADGIVDYGQILRGELADADSDGVPDLCESTILVPSQFPTIQAAIDSVPAGAQRTVQVGAGTYNESFSLNGKDVLIRGAADGTTILDGTSLPESIATFSGGEPATAGLESLVFRNATVGSLIYKGALFKVGGAVYGRDSSAVIRNCRFEGNRSDYGGGAYLLYCNMLVEGCEFTGNTGIAQGGGLMVFGTTGTVRNCTFTGNQCGIAGVGGGSAFKAAGALLTGESVTFDGCTVTGNTAGVEGGAVEYYENVELNPGTLHIVNSTITGNRSGNGTLAGAGGVMIAGRMQSVVVHGGTTVCDNVPRNIEGPYFIAGAPTICDCMADLSGDGAVNGGDLGLLLNAWGGTLPTGVGDVNHDGIVDGVDLAELLGNWGACN